MKKYIFFASIFLWGCQGNEGAKRADKAQSVEVAINSADGAPDMGHYVEIPNDKLASVIISAKSGDVQSIQRLESHYAYTYDLAAHNAELLKKEHERWKALLMEACNHSKCEPLVL